MLEPVEASVAAFNVLAYTVVGARTQWGETREKIIGVVFCPRLLVSVSSNCEFSLGEAVYKTPSLRP